MEGILNNIPTSLNGAGVASAGNIQELIKSLSITGNIMLDTMILMNLYTFFKSYLEIAATMLKDYTLMLLSFIVFYVKQKVKSRLTGKIVFRCEIKEKDQMYSTFFKHIIESNMSGDVEEDWKFKWLKIENDLNGNEKNYFERWRYQEESYDRPTELSINYFDDSQKLKFKQSYGMSDKITKIFRYTTKPGEMKEQRDDNVRKYFETSKTFYVRVTWKKYEYSGTVNNPGGQRMEMNLDLILFDMPKIQIPKSAYFQILYNFLDSRFEFFNTMLYVYNLNTDQNGHFYANINQNMKFRNQTDGWTIYGDDNEKLVDEIIDNYYLKKDNETKTHKTGFVNPLSTINMHVSPKDLDHDYREDIKIKSSKNTGYLYKYAQLGYAMGLKRDHIEGGNRYGYFQHNGMVVLIIGSHVWVAKNGAYVTEKDIQDVIQHMIEVNLNYTKNQVKPKKAKAVKKQVYVYKRQDGDWESHILSKRSFDTIYLPEALKKDIVKEFNNFIQMQHLYKEYEIPYRKGVLFYGPPGTGKTSVVKAIAFEYQIPLYILDVNDKEINDDSIVSILNSLGGNGMKILLFEDIDTAFADKEKMAKESKLQDIRSGGVSDVGYNYGWHENDDGFHLSVGGPSGDHPPGAASLGHYIGQLKDAAAKGNGEERKFLTYSGLLNALDGVMSNQTGVITIMTTNYIDRLGQAFMRPGRIDCKFELKECNKEQIETMTKYFVKNRIRLAREVFSADLDEEEEYQGKKLDEKASAFSDKLTNERGESHIKPCELQSYLLKHIDHIPNVFDNVGQISAVNATIAQTASSM